MNIEPYQSTALQIMKLANEQAGATKLAFDALIEIDRICRTPTSAGEKAGRHFQRDFDAIRRLTAPFCATSRAVAA